MAKDSKQILKKRWGSPELLKQAAARRDHLNVQPLRFGQKDAETEYIISLLPQAHNAYYLGYLEACIAMCGNLLEAFLAKLIVDKNLKTMEDIQNLALHDLIKIIGRKHWLGHKDFSLLHNVKELRNHTLHGRIPIFEYQPQAAAYICELPYGPSSSREIEIPEAEVCEIDNPSEQITAWYCLKKSRYILHCLLPA